MWGGTSEDERRAIRRPLRRIDVARKMTITMVITKRSKQNMEYVRRLLRQKQPGFAATLELAADLVGRELVQCPDIPALEARELALASAVSARPPEMPCAPRVIADGVAPLLGPGHGVVPVTPPLPLPSGPVLKPSHKSIDQRK